MSLLLALATGAVVFATSAISGVFGMSGGMILMGYLAWVLPVGAAMMLHGATQATANGYRAVLNRRDISWPVFGEYSLGALGGLALLATFAFVPDKMTVYLLLGIVPFAAAAVPRRLALDITKRGSPFICGFLVTLLNLTAGVAGALLDVFFVRTSLTRHQVVATKAVTQTLSHLLKLGYFGVLAHGAVSAAGEAAALPWWIYAVAVPLSMAGTAAGKRVLDAMNDHQFRRWSQWITLVIGGVLLLRGVSLFAG
jgi:uncharacterized membrane protein YfcA